MAQQQAAAPTSSGSASASAATTATPVNSSAAASFTNTNLFPALESHIAPLDDSEANLTIVKVEKELVMCLRDLMPNGNLLDEIGDRSILPVELFSNTRRVFKPKLDPLKRLRELPTEEPEEEKDQEDEEQEDEEQEVVEDEEDDAGGDYLNTHFDNGENYEDNDDEGDDMSGMM